MPPVPDLLLFLALGAALGVVGGLLGVGGGMVAIPVLAIGFNFSQQLAQGTALAMVAPNLLIGLWGYGRRPGFDWRVAAVMGAVGLPFAYLGAHTAVHTHSASLRLWFAGYMAFTAIWTAVRALRTKPGAPRPARAHWLWVAPVAAVGGGLTGMFSIGGASVAVPMLTTAFGFTQVAAQGATLGLIAPSTLTTMVTYALTHDVDWAVGIPLAIGGMASVPFGVRLAHHLPDKALRLIFAGFLAASGIALFTHPG